MTIISVSFSWVEAHDQPCKDSKEIRKSATASHLTKFRLQNPPKYITAALRITSVIYFLRNRSAYAAPRIHTSEITTCITAFGKNHLPEVTIERLDSAPPKAGMWQRFTRTLDAARQKGQSQAICNKEHLKSITGQTTNRKKNTRDKIPPSQRISHLPCNPRRLMLRIHVCISPSYQYPERTD
jgi:hypothetical protein